MECNHYLKSALNNAGNLNLSISQPENSVDIKISSQQTLQYALSNTENIDVDISQGKDDITVNIDILPVKVIGDVQQYQGEYSVDSDFVDNTLQTKDKFLVDNITIKKMNVTSVSNDAGGRTVWIGEM